jgi:hypothetical protein
LSILLFGAACCALLLICRAPEVARFYTLENASSSMVWKPVPKDMPPPGYICGAMGGNSIKIQRNYLFLWPQYEGESIHESTDSSSVRGCHEKLAALPMSMTWPGLQPHLGGFYPPPTDIRNGIQMIVRPEPTGNLLLFSTLLDYLGDNALTKMQKARAVSPGLKKAAGTTGNGGLVMVYWTDFNKPRPAIFICRWLSTGYLFYGCEGRFVIEPQGVRVDVIISPEKMVDWRRMIDGAERMIRSSLKPFQ